MTSHTLCIFLILFFSTVSDFSHSNAYFAQEFAGTVFFCCCCCYYYILHCCCILFSSMKLTVDILRRNQESNCFLFILFQHCICRHLGYWLLCLLASYNFDKRFSASFFCSSSALMCVCVFLCCECGYFVFVFIHSEIFNWNIFE